MESLVTGKSGSSIRRARSVEFLNTTAGPECERRRRSLEAEAFITQPLGERFPDRTTREEEG